MAGKNNIKWRSRDTQKLENEIKRFNAKIYRTRKAHPELENILPAPIKKQDKHQLIEKLQSNPRSEFNKTINSLSRFNRKGSEKAITSKTGFTVTKWEKNEMTLKVAQINRERTKERKAIENMNATSRGKDLGLKRGEMGSERLNELKPKKFDFDKIRSPREWEKLKETIIKQTSPEDKQERYENYKDNYITGLEEFGGYASDIQEMIKMLPAEKVVEVYYTEQEATISFFYEKQDMDTKLDILRDIWERAVDEYLNENNS